MAIRPPSARDLASASGTQTFHTTFTDIVSGYGGPVAVIGAGVVAGMLMWVPIFAVLAFNALLATKATRDAGVWASLAHYLVLFFPYILGTGALGGLLALLRRASAKIGWHVEIAAMRLGLNGVFASVAGIVIGIATIALSTGAGFLLATMSVGVLIGGFIINAIWESIHNRLLSSYGARRRDALLAAGAERHLARRKDLAGFTLDSVAVQNGRATVRGSFRDTSLRDVVESALRGIESISTVEFRRPSG